MKNIEWFIQIWVEAMLYMGDGIELVMAWMIFIAMIITGWGITGIISLML